MRIEMMESTIPVTKNATKLSQSQSSFFAALETAMQTNSNETDLKKAEVVTTDLQQLIDIFSEIPESFLAELQGVDVANQHALFELIIKDDPNLSETLQAMEEQMKILLQEKNSLEFSTLHSLLDEEEKSLSMFDTKDKEPINALIDKLTLLLSQASQLGLRELLQVPAKELGSIVDIAKKIQVSVQTTQSHVLGQHQLDELDSVMEELLIRIKTLESEKRLQKLGSVLDAAFSKGQIKKDATMLLPNQHMNLVKITPKTMITEAPIVAMHNQEAISKTEQFVLHVGNRPTQEPKATELIKAFSNILAKSQLSQTPGSTRLLIKLYPEHLGSLRVELLQKEGMMMARMIASSSTAKDMLDSQLHSLKQAFNQQNIQVDRIEVTFSQNDLQKYMNQHARDEGNNRDEQNNTEHNSDENDDIPAFAEALNTILFETEV
ncbi:flagellar hook-length control protein FliK [Lederbergia lenta]|uniref:Flagellar hook length control protein n=1 Tax=Lederbergia lenta TaxID=1467 RepID=A0A2X4WRI8_LEDLE|nr:flagellar hook-length control protein FliK [Lederbergia lenta]MEC2324281.1 flagellar hook-length control protein FliK [Lederbergia lenta]SQI60230.1 flagellar hook length control protein [Lederbergia lenta]